MNENDKILIHAYLDGETSDDESIYIESLLESNKNANEYANIIKKANNDINSFYKSKDFKELKNDVTKFTDSLITDKKSTDYFEIFKNLFTTPKLATFALVSVIFLNFGYFSEESFKQFEDKSILTEVMKLRSGSDTLSDALIISLDQMIDNKSLSGTLKYGSDEYEVLLKKFYEVNNKKCFEGTANLKFFKYCQNGDKKELIFN